jgi:hypothetical protein
LDERGVEPAGTAIEAPRVPGGPVSPPETAAAELEQPPAAKSDEREAASEPRAGPAVVRVLDESGAALAGARVLLVRGEDLLLDEVTDGLGEVRRVADSDTALVIVALESRPPHLEDIVLEPGRHYLRLPRANCVSGRLVCANGEAPAGIELRLESDHPLVELERVCEVIRSKLDRRLAIRSWLWSEVRADGGFEFAGLHETWSGVVRAPRGWRVTSTTTGNVEAYASGVRLEHPSEGLVLRIARKSVLRGRLVLADDGSPLGDVGVFAQLRSPDAPDSQRTNAGTDGAGYFELPRPFAQISALELWLGSWSGPLVLRLDGAAFPPDGELGEIAVDDLREVPYLVRDSSGAPVRYPSVLAGGMKGSGADPEGRGVVRWVARSIDRLRVEARGFLPAEVEIPPVIARPIEVTLHPANRLEVQLVPPEGGSPDLFKVVLVCAEGLTAVPVGDSRGQMAHVDDWALPPYDLNNEPKDTWLAADPDPTTGTAGFRGLRPGVAIELEVRGITGDAVYHRRTLAPLGPSEERRVEVLLGEGMLVFRGRVVDREGNGLVRATVQLGGQILDWTDDQGEFHCFLLADEPKTLVIQHQACSTLFLHDYAPPADGRPVELVLSPARRVTVEVVDVAGAPVPQAEVWIQQEGFTTNTHRVDGARHVASSLTENPFEIVVRLAGRVYEREHTADRAQARVVVPVHGRVVATVPDATTANRAGEFRLVLHPEPEEPAEAIVVTRAAAPALRLELPAVHPGTYEARLRYLPTDAEREAGAQDEACGPVEIAVEAGAETVVLLDLPAQG